MDIEAGDVAASTAQEVPVVRFNKSLGSTDPARSASKSIEDFAEQNERSVIVVQAGYVEEFLDEWSLSPLTDTTLRTGILA